MMTSLPDLSLKPSGSASNFHLSPLWPCLIIFLAAFIPRVLALDAFVAPDEGKWIYRSAHFLQAFGQGDLAGMTSVAATPEVEVLAPAVPTMWAGAVGLAAKYWAEGSPGTTLTDYLKAIPSATEKIPLDFYPWTRFPIALLTSLTLLAFYGLFSRLFSAGLAWLTAFLLALDPFFLGLSRVIHHDALLAVFTLLSLLTLLIYRQTRRQTSKLPLLWLIASGLTGGLALLTKPTALYLVIFTAIFLFFEDGRPRSRRDWQSLALECLVWGGTALLTFVLFWPALWVAPWETLTALFNRSANAVSDSNNYSLLPAPGTPLPELGFLFYPVNWLFKTTPVVIIGLTALLWGLWRGRFRDEPIGKPLITNHYLLWLILFSGLFLLLLIPADTRDIRYFLPGALALYPVAVVGLAALSSRITTLGRPLFPITPPAFLVAILLASQLLLTFIYYPYYVDYLNPLVGGPLWAPRLIKLGAGEGLDQMGRYLNQKPNAKQLTVATSFWESFGPFFVGRYTKSHYDEEADYLLIYLRQVQNNNPFPEYWTYFSARRPEYQVSLVGLDYAWLYPGPQLRVVRDKADFGNGLRLRGYRLEQPAAQPGKTANLTLVWSGADPTGASQPITVRLADSTGQTWTRATGPLLAAEGPSPVEGHYRLDLPADLPRGDYPLIVSLGGNTHQAGLIPVRQLDQPPVSFPASVNFGDLITFGGAEVIPPDQGEIKLKLLWQARQPISKTYTTFVHLVDAAGNLWAQADRIPQPGGVELPATAWTTGEWVVDSFGVSLKPETPPGRYTLLVGVYDSTTLARLPIIGPGEVQTITEITSLTVPE